MLADDTSAIATPAAIAAAANMNFFICVSLSAATRGSLRLKIRNPSNAVERQRTATSDTQIARTAHHFLGFVKHHSFTSVLPLNPHPHRVGTIWSKNSRIIS